MDKQFLSLRVGGADNAAGWLRLSPAAYASWPESMAHVMTDRAVATVLRAELASALGVTPAQWWADARRYETILESMLSRISVAAVTAHLMERVPPKFLRHGMQTTRPARKKPPMEAAAGVV